MPSDPRNSYRSWNLLTQDFLNKISEMLPIQKYLRNRGESASNYAINMYKKGCCFVFFFHVDIDKERKNSDVF